MAKFSEETIVAGGAGVAIVQNIIFRNYVDPQFGLIPYIGGYLGPIWGRWSTLGNIILGGIAFGLSQFTNVISNKSYTANSFLKIYGITTLIGGIVSGVLPSPAAATLSQAQAPTGNGYVTSTYYPGVRGTFYRRPQSRAKGFASDVTINPMAAIPTKVPTNKILF